jgi:hypothetical protein
VTLPRQPRLEGDDQCPSWAEYVPLVDQDGAFASWGCLALPEYLPQSDKCWKMLTFSLVFAATCSAMLEKDSRARMCVACWSKRVCGV